MNAREFERRLAQRAGLTASEVDQRMRGLRENGTLPVGGRGPHAPEIDEAHAAAMILQLVPRRATEADARWIAIMDNLNLILPPGLPEPFGVRAPDRVALPTAVIFLLQNPDFEWLSLSVACDGSEARLTSLREEQPFDLFFSARPDLAREVGDSVTRYRRLGASSAGHRFSIGAGLLKTWAANVNTPAHKRSGWVGDDNHG